MNSRLDAFTCICLGRVHLDDMAAHFALPTTSLENMLFGVSYVLEAWTPMCI